MAAKPILTLNCRLHLEQVNVASVEETIDFSVGTWTVTLLSLRFLSASCTEPRDSGFEVRYSITGLSCSPERYALNVEMRKVKNLLLLRAAVQL